jgi:hypothetical protein
MMKISKLDGAGCAMGFYPKIGLHKSIKTNGQHSKLAFMLHAIMISNDL